MDSVTQIVLGAAVGEAVLGKRVGYRAAMWGAVCGTIPDLDVFYSFGDPVSDFTYHRSFSHSLLVLALVSPVVAWMIRKIHGFGDRDKWRWLLLVYLVFASHALLDAFTVYGTQIFWPIVDTPVGFGSIFIIDPAYTLPLLAGVLIALFASRAGGFGHRANTAGLMLSTLYLLWGLGVKTHVEQVAGTSLAARGVDYERLMVTPAPFNTILWRGVAVGDGQYHEGFYSLLDGTEGFDWTRYPSAETLLDPVATHWPVQRLQWFTRGFYKVGRVDADVVMTDLRMGVEPDYVFAFKVGEIGNPHITPAPSKRYPPQRNWNRVPDIMRRIWDEDAFPPAAAREATATTN